MSQDNVVVVVTIPGDFHAHAVAEAARELDLNIWVWPTTELRINQEVTIFLEETCRLEIKTPYRSLRTEIDQIRGLWYRRMRDLDSPGQLHPADESSSSNNAQKFRASALSVLNTTALCINRVYAANQAENKLFQLWCARDVGLDVPSTMMTNSRKSALDYLAKINGAVLAKFFMPASWQTNQGTLHNFSAEIDADLSPSSNIMQADAVILQPYLRKSFEVRITWFGQNFIAVRLDSQSRTASVVDWRVVDPAELSVEETQPPETVINLSCALMKRMNLVFACMDFVVDKSGSWIFLELN
jgi:glutathione synthase/RimK-type ligase-like ATP-grasp enzyme